MRAGQDVTQKGVTVSGTGTTMGYGNVNIALSLATAQAGEDTTTKVFLTALDQVVDMRARGMGWRQIAKDLGFNLGQIVSGSKSNRPASATAKVRQDGQGLQHGRRRKSQASGP